VKVPYLRVSPSTLIMAPPCLMPASARIGPAAWRAETKVGGSADPGRLRPDPVSS
jgi:hypothetical protein